MVSAAAIPLAEIGSGFAVAAVVGLVLLGCAAIATVRELRTTGQPEVIAACLLGAVSVGSQLAIASSAPASRIGFLLGTVGGWCWYAGWLQSSRRRGLAEQGLAVGGLLWVAGTITLAVSLSGTGWPVHWSLRVGLAAIVGTAILDRAGRNRTAPRRVLLAAAPVAATFVVPAVIGRLFGSELLFVLFLIWTVSALIGWSLVRLAQAG